MALNIKNEATCEAIRRLAEARKVGLTRAVDLAVRESLLKVGRDDRETLAADLLKIGRECASHIPEPWRSVDHGDLLYDEMGLPRNDR